MKPKVLILEDDFQLGKDLKASFEANFNVEVETMSSESEFRAGWEKIVAGPPQLAVLDLMAKWAKPLRGAEAEKPPADAKKRERAGVRCAQKLRERFAVDEMKIIIYSVFPRENFEKDGIPDGVETVVKNLDFQNLLEKIRELMPDIEPTWPINS